jgi:hypothetical protein
MSRKRCIRKVWALVNPIAHAMHGASVTPPEKMDQLHMRELASLDALTQGLGRMAEWSDMVNVNNLAQTLAGMGVGRAEVMPVCHAAEAVLIEAAERYQRTKRMGLSGHGIQTLRDVIEYHQLQRSSIPRSQYEEAIRLTEARIRSGHATIDLEKTIGPSR